MPEITPHNTGLKALSGRHLWHAPLSSCSQRVRLVLSELGLAYEGHVLDLEEGEHATQEYQAIHPDGVVPAFVHDGRLYVESIDIINQIADGAFGTQSPREIELLDRANAAQRDLKLLTFEFLFRAKPPASESASETFQKNHKNAWLRQFYLDFAAGFDPQRISDAVQRTQAGFELAEATLSDGQPFLGGTQFGLADIAWLPNVHRMQLMGWPFEGLQALERWFNAMRLRPSYKAALLNWQDEPVANTFGEYTKKRHAEGTDVRSYLRAV